MHHIKSNFMMEIKCHRPHSPKIKQSRKYRWILGIEKRLPTDIIIGKKRLYYFKILFIILFLFKTNDGNLISRFCKTNQIRYHLALPQLVRHSIIRNIKDILHSLIFLNFRIEYFLIAV